MKAIVKICLVQLIAVIFGLAFNAYGQAQPLKVDTVQTLSLPAGDGELMLNDFVIKTVEKPDNPYAPVKMQRMRAEYFAFCNVVNKTKRDIHLIRVEVMAFTEAGTPIKPQSERSLTLYIYDMGKDKTKPIWRTSEGYHLFPSYGARIASYTLKIVETTFNPTYVLSMTKPANASSLSFEDDAFSIVWGLQEEGMAFTLRNKTENPIGINWNQVSFVDVEANAHKVMHQGVKFISRNETIASTTVPPMAKVTDTVVSVDQIEQGSRGNWITNRLFPLGEAAQSYKGKSFSVFMPLEINGVVKNYSFAFKIADVHY